MSVTCPMCGGAGTKHLMNARDFLYGVSGRYDYRRCESCAGVFLSPMLNAEQLSRLYPSGYYSYQPPKLERPEKRALRRLLGFAQPTSFPGTLPPGRLLDVGCGAGHFMQHMRARGWDVTGCELSVDAAEAGRSVGLDIFAGELAAAQFRNGSFDVVRFSHSLEHIPDLHGTLAEVHRILKPGGSVVIAVPNIAGTWARLFGGYWWHLAAPLHVYQFTPASLERVLAATGFVEPQLSYTSDWGGLLGSLYIYQNRARPLADHNKTLLRVKPLITIAFWLSRVLDRLGKGDCIEIIAKRAEFSPQLQS